MPHSATLAPSGAFCLRTPLLPFGLLAEWGAGRDASAVRDALRRLARGPELREAILLASPALHDALTTWLDAPGTLPAERQARVERAVIKYLTRLTTRPTPFGLFATVATGTVGRDTRLEVSPAAACRRHTRLDNALLFALAQALHADPAVVAAARFRPNDSLVFTAGRGRYTEARPAASGHSFHLVEVDDGDALQALLARARDGATQAELVATLAGQGHPAAAAAAFVAECIASQLLVSDLAVHVTGPEPTRVLADRLATIPAAAPVARQLHDTLAALERLDAAPPGGPAAAYDAIAAGLAALPVPVDRQRLFQVDLVRPTAGSLGTAVLDEVRRGVELLQRLTPPHLSPLDRFTRAFVARYHGRAVPLLEALDHDAGLGSLLDPAADPSPLLQGLPLRVPAPPEAAHGPRERHLLHQASLAAATGRREWALTADDLAVICQADPPPLPPDLAAFATLAAAAPEAVARGDFTLHLPLADAGAARLLGRFCHADPALHEAVRAHLCTAEAAEPDALHAELVHLPEGRIGNILLRPVLRDWEITFLGHSGAPPERQLPASDLLLQERDGRLELWSARLGRRVVPHLATAHNVDLGLTPYRFLALLEHQGYPPVLRWDWGPAAALAALPRVTHGRLVLALAQWRLTQAELRALGQGPDAARLDALQALRTRRGLPRWVTLADGDHRLPVDLDNPLAAAMLAHELHDASEAVLEELWPAPGELLARGPDGAYRHELVIPLHARPASATAPAAARGTPPALPTSDATPRRFPPGSEWLYVKLYGSEGTADRVLQDLVAPLVRRFVGRGTVRRWFFVRYADPEPHLRWRLAGDPAVLRRRVWPAIEKALAPLVGQGLLHRVQLDTYERELERYGGPEAIPHAEAIFQADSEAVLELLPLLAPGDAGLAERWQLALAGMDRLFADLGLDLPARLRQLHESGRYGAVPAPDAALRHALTARHREHRSAITALLDPATAAESPLAPGLEVLAARSTAIAPPAQALRTLAAAGALTVPLPALAGSLLHMHANRLLATAPNAHETVLYDFLRRHYDSHLARLPH
ncbi:MAG: lantibiotic dehydratase [Gemmatimonadetes bacterium]|nr:lantibiotic dehydratase [Gemmatimonadota bacterium]